MTINKGFELREMCGERIIIATGRTAIGDAHLGDWGLPMGLVLAELEERYGDNLPILTTDLLNEIYPFASKKSKENLEFLEKARKKIDEAGRSLEEAQDRNRIIQKKLKGVEEIDTDAATELLGLEE